VEGELVAGVYDTVQPLDDNVQEEGLNVPPALLSFHNMVPVGVVGELEVSLTVTVSVTDDPGLVTGEFDDTATVVESGVLETDVLLLSVNIILLLSAIAGTVKPPKSDEPNT
jgi:hypothetical protein